jgi:uncharacterized membrane protein
MRKRLLRQCAILVAVPMRPAAVNDDGQVVGSNRAGALLWHAGEPTRELGAFAPVDMNNRSEVVGVAGDQGVLWREGALTELGADFRPIAINESGQILGCDSNRSSCALWSDGARTPLPFIAAALNDRGQVAGFRVVSVGPDRDHTVYEASLWADGTIVASLGNFTTSALNNHGDVVLVRPHRRVNNCCNVDRDVVLWHDGRTTTLMTHTTFGPSAINERDEIAGGTGTMSGDDVAMRVDRGGVVTILSNGYLSSAHDINEDGQIVGEIMEYSVLWSPGST